MSTIATHDDHPEYCPNCGADIYDYYDFYKQVGNYVGDCGCSMCAIECYACRDVYTFRQTKYHKPEDDGFVNIDGDWYCERCARNALEYSLVP